MKRRSSVLRYILTLATGGQFAFAWLFLMAFDVNQAKRNYVPWLTAVTIGFVVLYVVYLSLVGYNMYQISRATAETYSSVHAQTIPMWPLFLMATLLLACSVYLLVKIASFLRQSGVATPRNGVLVLLFFLYLISLPMLQNRLNNLHDMNGREHR